MPVKLKSGHQCYLIEYREGHSCPLVLGLGENIVFYVRDSEIA